MTVNKITNAPTQNEVIGKINEVIDNLGGGGATDVQINGTSITNQGVANIVTNTAYNATSNKIVTMSDVPSITHLANKNLDNLSATGESHFLKNIAGGTNSLSILAYGNVNGDNATSIGVNSRALGNGSISLGTDASNYAQNSIAIGYQANVVSLCDSAIQLGYGTNSTAKSLNVGFYDSSTPTNYQLLDGTTGLIPDARISTNIQRTSTAVTHTANTAVGSSTKPVYISSTGAATASTSTVGGSSTPVYLNAGTITSTGLSIASSRFDGQWVQVSSAVQLTTDYTPSSSVYSISLTGHLPSGSSNYNVLLYASLYTKTSSGNSIGCYLGSDLLPITTTTYTKGILLSQARTRTSSNMTSGASCILPVGSSKTVYLFAPSDWRNGTINLFMTAYRRIGTNS